MNDNEQQTLLQEYEQIVKAFVDALSMQTATLQLLDSAPDSELDKAGAYHGAAAAATVKAQRRWKAWYANHAGQFRQLAPGMQQIERRYGFTHITPSPSPVPSQADAIKSVLKTSKRAD